MGYVKSPLIEAALQEVLEALRVFFKANQASTYLVATSGGKDSMLLCELMRMLALPFEIMHLNYRLRGKESDEDAAFLEAYCKKYNLPFHLKCIELSAELQHQHKNLQAEARRIRYEFFQTVQQNQPNSLICTAHHADDQIETFWLQLFRGAGMKGLAAMQTGQKGVLRPLLNFEQKTLQTISTALQLRWREDSSNNALKYRRNLWRHALLPFVNSQLPHLDQAVLLLQKQFAKAIESQDAVLRITVKQLQNSGCITLNDLSQLSAYQFVESFKLYGLPTHVIKRLPDLFWAANGKNIAWQQVNNAQKSYVVKQNGQLLFLTADATEWSYAIEALNANDQAQLSTYLIDLQQIEGALFFRQVQDGDRMRVAGMNGTKKVLQILKEAGLPAPLRKQQFVFCDQQKIIAVPNLQLNAMVQARENSTHLAVLHFSKKL
jgi:tRNA(Ile)-lysidine synthase